MEDLSRTMVKSPSSTAGRRRVNFMGVVALISLAVLFYGAYESWQANDTLAMMKAAAEQPIPGQELSNRPVSLLYPGEGRWIRTEDVRIDHNGNLWTDPGTLTFYTNETSPYRHYIVVFDESVGGKVRLEMFEPSLDKSALKIEAIGVGGIPIRNGLNK